MKTIMLAICFLLTACDSYQITGDSSAVWRVNTTTGAISRCAYQSGILVCSPESR